MSMTEWAKREIEIAIKKERGVLTKGSFLLCFKEELL